MSNVNLARFADEHISLSLRPLVTDEPSGRGISGDAVHRLLANELEIEVMGQLELGPSKEPRLNDDFALHWDCRRALEEAINDLLICAIIAHPGTVAIDGPRLPAIPSMSTLHAEWDNGSPRIQDRFGDAVQISRALSWPPIRTLSLKQVHDWARRLPGWRRGVSANSVDRAFAALVALVGSPVTLSPVDVVWALVGLEALFTHTHASTREQMLAGAESLLREPCLADRNLFAAMYDFRSKFLHGRIDLPYVHRDTDEDQEATTLSLASRRAHACAVALLLSSIQELIVRDWTAMEMTMLAVRP